MPAWTERNPADLGIALVEMLAYVGDALSYQQDAIATEAYLGTARRRVSVTAPDIEHLHHRLVQLGHGHRRAVLILWAWTAILSAVVLVPTYTNRGNALVVPLIAGLGVGLYTLLHPDVRRRNLEIVPGDESPSDVA